MQFEEKKNISNLRLEKAHECLRDAKFLLEANSFKGSANRAYYAVFHAMRAVLALDGIDMKHHSGIISEFRKRYIRTNIFDKKFSDTISLLSDSRNDSDYDDFYVISKQAVIELVDEATLFLSEVSTFLSNKTD